MICSRLPGLQWLFRNSFYVETIPQGKEVCGSIVSIALMHGTHTHICACACLLMNTVASHPHILIRIHTHAHTRMHTDLLILYRNLPT